MKMKETKQLFTTEAEGFITALSRFNLQSQTCYLEMPRISSSNTYRTEGNSHTR